MPSGRTAVAAVWESLEVAGKEASLEAAASEGKFPYMEAFVYNRALLLAYAEDLEKAERCCRLLMCFKASLKNARLIMYILLQKGERQKAKEFCDEYMLKVWRVC